MTVTMSHSEREAFLAGVHVGALAVAQPSGPPLITPVWYAYAEGGQISISTEGSSRKARLLQASGYASLCVQDERPPYKYVTVECAVAAVERATMDERRALALRYLGPVEGERFAAELEDSPSEIMVRLLILKWRTVDYGKEEG